MKEFGSRGANDFLSELTPTEKDGKIKIRAAACIRIPRISETLKTGTSIIYRRKYVCVSSKEGSDQGLYSFSQSQYFIIIEKLYSDMKKNLFPCCRGWSGGAMVLGKLPVPERPTNLDNSWARAYSLAVGGVGVCLDIFSLIYHFSFVSPSLWETA